MLLSRYKVSLRILGVLCVEMLEKHARLTSPIKILLFKWSYSYLLISSWDSVVLRTEEYT